MTAVEELTERRKEIRSRRLERVRELEAVRYKSIDAELNYQEALLYPWNIFVRTLS